MLALWCLIQRFVGGFVGSLDRHERALEGAVWLGVVVVLIGLAGVVLAFVRRRFRRTGQRDAIGFDLNDLKRLHAIGELSDEEFQRLRTRVLESFGSRKGT